MGLATRGCLPRRVRTLRKFKEEMAQTIEDPTPPPAAASPAPVSSTPASATSPVTARRASVHAAPRRTRVVVRKVGPLSVLRFSLIFYFCVMLIVYFALMIIYWVLSAVGAIDSTERLLGQLFASDTVEIGFGRVFTWLFLTGLANVVLWSLVTVFVAFLYNLISDVVGGVEVTLAEKR